MAILVTGGEGYIGKVLINHLVKKYIVTYLDNLIYGQQQSIIHKNYSLLNVRIRDFDKLKNILRNFDKLYNELEFKPKFTIEYGINELINSLKKVNFLMSRKIF